MNVNSHKWDRWNIKKNSFSWTPPVERLHCKYSCKLFEKKDKKTDMIYVATNVEMWKFGITHTYD